jgi:hypothetical protein
MIPYIGSEILDALRHRSRTSPCPPAISPHPPHFDISDESDSVSLPVRREEAFRLQQNFTIVLDQQRRERSRLHFISCHDRQISGALCQVPLLTLDRYVTGLKSVFRRECKNDVSEIRPNQ